MWWSCADILLVQVVLQVWFHVVN